MKEYKRLDNAIDQKKRLLVNYFFAAPLSLRDICKDSYKHLPQNKLVIRLEPDEVTEKYPAGYTGQVGSVALPARVGKGVGRIKRQ